VAKKQAEYDELSRKMKNINNEQTESTELMEKVEQNGDSYKWQLRGIVCSKETKETIKGLRIEAFVTNNLDENIYFGSAVNSAHGTFCILISDAELDKIKLETLTKSHRILIVKVYDTEGRLLNITKNLINEYPVANMRIELIRYQSKDKTKYSYRVWNEKCLEQFHLHDCSSFVFDRIGNS
jgi:hypothetical protein